MLSGGSLWSSTRPTGCGTSTSRATSSPTRLKTALKDVPKLLLTATPLQNSLLELFGLVSFIDEQAFGDLKSFREQFAAINDQNVFDALKARLQTTLPPHAAPPGCRLCAVHTPAPDGRGIHAGGKRRSPIRPGVGVSPPRQPARPAGQPAVPDDAGAAKVAGLVNVCHRGRPRYDGRSIEGHGRQGANRQQSVEEAFEQDYESLDETAEEWEDEQAAVERLTAEDRAAIEQEIADLEGFRSLAVSITHNAKGQALGRARAGVCRGRPPGGGPQGDRLHRIAADPGVSATGLGR